MKTKKRRRLGSITLQSNGYYKVRMTQDGKTKSTTCKDIFDATKKLDEFEKAFAAEKRARIEGIDRNITVD